jgi:hypothetical protein
MSAHTFRDLLESLVAAALEAGLDPLRMNFILNDMAGEAVADCRCDLAARYEDVPF